MVVALRGMISPITLVRLLARLRAAACGVYWVSLITCRTRSRTSGRTLGWLFSTRETVERETWAILAICSIVSDVDIDRCLYHSGDIHNRWRIAFGVIQHVRVLVRERLQNR